MLKIQIKNIFDLWVDSVVIETLFFLVTLVPCRNHYWVLTQHFNTRSIYELNCLNIQNSPGTPLTGTTTPIASFMGPTWGASGADRTQVGPMLAPWILLSGYLHVNGLLSTVSSYTYLVNRVWGNIGYVDCEMWNNISLIYNPNLNGCP